MPKFKDLKKGQKFKQNGKTFTKTDDNKCVSEDGGFFTPDPMIDLIIMSSVLGIFSDSPPDSYNNDNSYGHTPGDSYDAGGFDGGYDSGGGWD